MKPKGTSGGRKPPAETVDHDVIQEWIDRAMPELQPVLKRVDALIRAEHPNTSYALKWKKAYYGLPDNGWIIELVAYDVSVNVVFLGGSDFDSPPPLGENGRSRYVKLHTLEDADSSELRGWIIAAGKVNGWG